MLTALLMLSAAVTLPASPRSVAVGDVDADGTSEIAVLLVWDRWGSISEDVSAQPGVMELEVKPAIEEKRELRVYEVRPDSVELAAEPMEVSADVLSLDADDPLGPVVAITDRGPQRVTTTTVVGTEDDQARKVLELELLAAVRPLFAGSERVVALSRFVFERGITGRGEVHVPTAHGLTIVEFDGSVKKIDSPLVEVRSGRWGILQSSIPRLEDVDGDGTSDLIAETATGQLRPEPAKKVAFWRGLGGGRLDPVRVWKIDGPLQLTADERARSATRRAVQALDIDSDGTLELAVAVQQLEADSFGEALDSMRGRPSSIEFYALTNAGVSPEPERVTRVEGHFFPLERSNGFRSPFLDLDGDREAELVTFTMSFGYFGALKAVVSKKARFKVHPVIHKGNGGSFTEVSGAMPTVVFKQNLRQEGLSRYFDWLGDLDGDGLNEFVEVDGDEMRIRRAAAGPRYGERPPIQIELMGPVSTLGWTFSDLDQDGDKDLIAFEPFERDPQAPNRNVRMEVKFLEFDR